MVGQLIRFGGVGGMATLVHVIVAMMMRGTFGFSPLQANFTGFASALLFSYLGHAYWTFGKGLSREAQFLRFLFVALVGLVISSGAVLLLDVGLGLDFGIAMLAVAVLVPTATYLALRFWVFETTSPREDTDWLGLGLSGALALAVLALFWGRTVNHDTAWYLIATREWLDGAALYVDLIEVNPPLNFYFTLPAIGLADLFGFSDTNGAYLTLALLFFLILCWCSTITREELGFSNNRHAFMLGGIAVALVLPALQNFGQREQVMVILAMPWLLGELASTPAPLRRQMTRAAVAALGICLKPYFVLFPLALTMLQVLRQRSPRPFFSVANLTFLAVGLGYIGYVLVVHPAYLSQIVPMAREVYGAYGSSVEIMFNRIAIEILLALVLAPVVLSRCPRYPDVDLFAAMALAGLGSYFLQGTGFAYHAIPFRVFALIAFFFVIIRSSQPKSVLITTSIAAAILMAINIERGFYHNYSAQQIAHVAQDLGRVDSLMVLSSHVDAGPSAAIASGARWVSRYPANWLVPGALNRLEKTNCANEPTTCAHLEAIAERNRADNLADIATSHPDLLVFDLNAGYFDEPGFSWETFMAQDPEWSETIKNYREIGKTQRYIYYHYTPEPQKGLVRENRLEAGSAAF
ncbi:GtrA family protein [Pseudohalocynthiibacter aestuariivivens]|uniref:GtrA family protein n=1 Tax=Pseudohalocynthiibacter aestuariivivens TaxID=1591409 RepID=A0ABV5JGW6_9RHOB|nr:GtrA family protein [Pseudohalocynthiibacter aestuariivivens]